MSEPSLFDQLAIFPTSVLAGPVRVVDKPDNRPPAAKHHRKGVTAKLCAHVILYGPANNLARSYTLHTRQIKPASVRVDIGDIGQPNGIGIRQ